MDLEEALNLIGQIGRADEIERQLFLARHKAALAAIAVANLEQTQREIAEALKPAEQPKQSTPVDDIPDLNHIPNEDFYSC